MAFECQDYGTNIDYSQKNFQQPTADLYKQFLRSV